MKTMGLAVAMVAAMALGAGAQEQSLTKDDVIKLMKAGVSDDVIIAKLVQDKASFTLSADDILNLKAQGASDKLIQHLQAGKKAEAPAAPAAADGKNARFRNVSHRAVKVSINEKEMLVNFSVSTGTDLPINGTLDLAAKAGDYKVAIEGRSTIEQVRIPESGSCSLTVKGANTEYIDVQTIIAEDTEGSRVIILHSEGKQTEGQLVRPAPGVRRAVYIVEHFRGPQLSFLPQVSDTVLLGAGIGAVIGHQRGHRTRGAIIGAAAGLLLDGMWIR